MKAVICWKSLFAIFKRRFETLVGAVLLLGAIGYLVDLKYGTSPWFLLGGLLLGIVVGFYELAKTVWKK